jgi:hypothetical protein
VANIGRPDELEALLNEAAAADPGSRIEFRDRIAAFGPEAVRRLEPWLNDPRLAGFAVRVTERAAAYQGRAEAIAALRNAAANVSSRTTVADATDALTRLAPPKTTRPSSGARRDRGRRTAASYPELEVGRVYRRRELHLDGLGGNWQSGISYPADGTYVLLFSDPEKGAEHGYRDRWQGDHYLYYGQWTGTGDMVFEVGNRAILDRGTDLHLLIRAGAGHRYEGRFRLVRHETARTVRDGREWSAIVFVLERLGHG